MSDTYAAAIEQLAKDLPNGYVVTLSVENGAAWVELIGPEGTIDLDFDSDSTFAEQLVDALTEAVIDEGRS